MADFNDDHKVEGGNYFPEGVHKVKIMSVNGGINDNGKEFINFEVTDDDGHEGSAKMWFTSDKAIKFTFNTIRGIFVHNALEAKKEAAKEMVNKTKNSEELVELCAKALIGKEAFYTVEKSDYTYTNQAGELKNGYNRNLTGYKPEPKPTADNTINGDRLSSDEVPDDVFPDL